MRRNRTLVFVCFFIFTACKHRKKVPQFNHSKEFEIKTIHKSNDYPSSLQDTSICNDWTLGQLEIQNIVGASKAINSSEKHYYFDHLPCRVHGMIIQRSCEYEYSINSGAWFTIGSFDTTLIFGNFNENYNKYFLSEAFIEEEEN